MLRGCVLRHLSVFYYVTPSGSTLTAPSKIQTEQGISGMWGGHVNKETKDHSL